MYLKAKIKGVRKKSIMLSEFFLTDSFSFFLDIIYQLDLFFCNVFFQRWPKYASIFDAYNKDLL